MMAKVWPIKDVQQAILQRAEEREVRDEYNGHVIMTHYQRTHACFTRAVYMNSVCLYVGVSVKASLLM